MVPLQAVSAQPRFAVRKVAAVHSTRSNVAQWGAYLSDVAVHPDETAPDRAWLALEASAPSLFRFAGSSVDDYKGSGWVVGTLEKGRAASVVPKQCGVYHYLTASRRFKMACTSVVPRRAHQAAWPRGSA